MLRPLGEPNPSSWASSNDVLIDHREVWRQIPQCPGFEASEFGHLRRTNDLKLYTQYLDGSGYFTAVLDGKRFRSSRLICSAFHGPCPTPRHLVLHGNGDREDNRAINLRWGTQKENLADREAHGRTLHGSLNPSSKITEADALEIRRRCAGGRHGGGERQREVAAEFGLTQAAVSLIVLNKAWRRA